MAKPQTPVHCIKQSKIRTTGSYWIFLLLLLKNITCQTVSSPSTIQGSHCASYAANYRYVTELIQFQAAPSPPQALPVAIYQVSPSATYQILDQDLYPLLCFNISCLPHGDYHDRRCLWEVSIADRQCLQYTSDGSFLLAEDGKDSYMMGPDPANYPIVSHVDGDVFISLNGRGTEKLATVGDAEYVRLLNVSDNRSYVKFPSIDYINSEHSCLVINPCTLSTFDHVSWYLSVSQMDILYLKRLGNERAKLSVYNMCSKTWSHGNGDEPDLIHIPYNSWQKINIKTSKNSTEIIVNDKKFHYAHQSSKSSVCDETVYIIAVAGASFSLSCEANISSLARHTSPLEDVTFGYNPWFWVFIGAAALGLIFAFTVIVIYTVKRIKGNANRHMGPYERQISDISLLRSYNGHGTEC